MAEKPPPGNALPRFQPLKKNVKRDAHTQRTVPISASVPSFAIFDKKPKPPPKKKERAPQILEFGDAFRPSNARRNTNFATDMFAPTLPTEAQDAIVQDQSLDVKLPLVKLEEQKSNLVDILQSKEKLVLFQIPSALPIRYPNDTGQMEGNPLVGATDGHLGKIQIHKSGRVTAKIGNIDFELKSGTSVSCAQILCTESSTDGLEWVAMSGEKIILTLDVDKVLNQIDNESN
ncbi:hypothetical protein TVAG_458550 [Trichomonas vaginalis G3]|uniref:RNA polymerase III RPC4 family protein n=1 Tax=Trichomonas vaginalis (strain ATCC PRA-98 / G3) TaxID=412133 RepID=A2G7M1_TRIV3|nr:RNA polymerase III RPC4 family [Trichomonas vaginalis G3]EAX86843.1 hypothetical protein TVAG_458550 [Trichomonas vaginalis G3]KAI5552530.1 RNA polymerase III RPC4 family [Trichomonas vaginalis G3]|eukprot:XP_001299773.1 hypothetical protein [Trichomonas vaginalis G3]